MPKFSIITVAWNASATIADTMLSVAAQNISDYEHIIIDGASKDKTVEIALLHSTRNTIILSEPDNGIYDAMNKGLSIASGEYIGFLNADDFYTRTDALLILKNAIENEFSKYEPPALSAGVAIVKEIMPEIWSRSYSATHFRPWMLRFGHMPPHPGFYVRRDVAEKIGPLDTRYKISADFDFVTRFFQAGYRPTMIPQTLVSVREGGASNNGFQSRKKIALETGDALKKNGIVSPTLLRWAKYVIKGTQLIIPPREFPPPCNVSYIKLRTNNGAVGS